MFIDEVKMTLKAGKGGDGIISWRREKYIPKGGPFGGDGGNGGHIVLVATTHETTLGKFRHQKIITAEDGEKGGTQECHGATAPVLILEVPVGTIVTDAETKAIICDLVAPGQRFQICEGGKGGFGNAHFPSSTRQAPNFAELGDAGDIREVKMELKLVADVGLVGLPNAGKSTVIQSITNVKPKIAAYAFTTLIPNLGVMEWRDRSLVIEDVPGLIEGASEGKGLGFQFLKHIDRCRIIIHLLDATQGEEAMIENYRVIRKELENWNPEMANKEELIIFSKAELVDPEQLEEMVKIFEKSTGKKVDLTISAGAFIRIDELKDLLIQRIPDTREEELILVEDEDGIIQDPDALPTTLRGEDIPRFYDLKRQNDPKRCMIRKREDGDYEITGVRIEEIARMTDTRYTDGVNRVYDVMERMGVMRKLKLLISDGLTREDRGFFEGEDDYKVPAVWVGGKKFSLEGLIFMKDER
ncbi:GTPase ObgE [Candidatus Gracilibacteria bacterium]|nr:GTPase ObgE [Candidatus Gracilibacteria bacterium]